MNAKIRLGVIGAGAYTRRVLLPHFRRIPDVELRVVANRTRESAEAVARTFGFARIADDWQAVVHAEDVDAIVVGTRTEAHYEMIPPILEAGRPVLTMNALCRTAAQARELAAQAAARPGQVALVYPAAGHAYFLREDAMMRHLIEDGFLGDLLQVDVHWFAPFFGLGSLFEVGHRWCGRHTRVFGYRRAYEAARPTVAARPGRSAVRAETNFALAELAGGGVITYRHSTVAGDTARPRWELTGSAGTVVAYPGDADRLGRFIGARNGSTTLEPLTIPAAHAHPVTVEADFIAAIRGEREPSTAILRFDDAFRLLQFGEAWRESASSGGWVDLPQ